MESLRFALRFRDRQIRIDLSHDEERYALAKGDPLDVVIQGEPRLISTREPVVIRHPLSAGAT